MHFSQIILTVKPRTCNSYLTDHDTSSSQNVFYIWPSFLSITGNVLIKTGMSNLCCLPFEMTLKIMFIVLLNFSWGEWPSGLDSFRQVTEVKLGRVSSNSGWVTSEA